MDREGAGISTWSKNKYLQIYILSIFGNHLCHMGGARYFRDHDFVSLAGGSGVGRVPIISQRVGL